MTLAINTVRLDAPSLTAPTERRRETGRAGGPRAAARNAAPLAIVLAVLLGVWQLAASRPGSSLPPPTTVWTTSFELISDP